MNPFVCRRLIGLLLAAAWAAPFHALGSQWNQCEVIVMGDHYSIPPTERRHREPRPGLSVKEGRIGLQSETAEILYRNIMIKEFTEDQPIENFLK